MALIQTHIKYLFLYQSNPLFDYSLPSIIYIRSHMDPHCSWSKPLVNKKLQYLILGYSCNFHFRKICLDTLWFSNSVSLKILPLIYYDHNILSKHLKPCLRLTISVFFLAVQSNPCPCFCTTRFNTAKMKSMGDQESSSAVENMHSTHQYCVFLGGNNCVSIKHA